MSLSCAKGLHAGRCSSSGAGCPAIDIPIKLWMLFVKADEVLVQFAVCLVQEEVCKEQDILAAVFQLRHTQVNSLMRW